METGKTTEVDDPPPETEKQDLRRSIMEGHVPNKFKDFIVDIPGRRQMH